jgi:hypothetical protein
MKDLCLAPNVSRADARALQRWWARKGHTYLAAPCAAPFTKHRVSVWLQRVPPQRTDAETRTPDTP